MKKILTLSFLIIFSPFYFIFAQTEGSLGQRMKGKILLQVEQNGEAWYVHPNSMKRIFLGRPKDAFDVMRGQGVGVTNNDLYKIPIGVRGDTTDSDTDGLSDYLETTIGLNPNNSDTDSDGYNDKDELLNGYNPWGMGKQNIDSNFAEKQKGKILLQVEKSGEAWYVNPVDAKRYFLGRPVDAFNVMRGLGLGISDDDLNKIDGSISSDVVNNIEDKTKNITSDENDVTWIIEETQYDKIGEIYSIDGKLAYEASSEGKEFVVYDGQEQGRYDEVIPYTIKEIDKKIAYEAKDDGREFIVYDGKEQKRYDSVGLFAEVNNKVAYEAGEGESKFIVYDGVEQKKHEKIPYQRLIGVDNKLAYIATEGDESFMVFGGVEQKHYDSIDMYTVMNINEKLTYKTKKDGKEIIVYGEEEFVYDNVYYLSSIDNILVYKVKNGDESFVIYNGEEQKRYQELSPNFNNALTVIDGKFAYKIRVGDTSNQKEFVVYDGVEQKKYDEISGLSAINNKLTYIAVEGGNKFVVYDGQEQGRYDLVKELKAVDSKLAYYAKKGDEVFIVHDGEEQQKYIYPQKINTFTIDEIEGELLYLVEDSRQHFFEAFIVYDNKEQKKYGAIDNLHIIKVNGKLAYKASEYTHSSNNMMHYLNKQFVVYGTKEHEKYDLIRSMKLVNNKLVYVAEKDDKFYIVREK